MKYTIDIARDTTDPNILRDILLKNENDLVSCDAAQNPNCPSDALEYILKQNKNDYISMYAAQHHNCPEYLLTEILSRNKNNLISLGASKNPNASPKSVLDWMRNTGRIDKYDPNKHRIDDKPDKDLEILKNMLD